LGGDSGYSKEFASIGETYGPFDISFLENGAYNDDWSEIHMKPEQTVQAHIDLQSKKLFPIHWGKFDLSTHAWDEPISRLVKASNKNNVTLITPMIGEVFTL
jgi:L-ascorbate metabolism protein UlaG (beta-lactamase superfamily)